MDKKRILIVDDEENFAYIVKMNLEQSGDYEVMVEKHAVNALDAAISFSPHLILLDLYRSLFYLQSENKVRNSKQQNNTAKTILRNLLIPTP